MLSSKERSHLMSLATKLQPILQVGKGGINANLISQVSDALTARELIKLSVLNNCESNPSEIMYRLAEAVKAEPIKSIGNKIILYRYSNKRDIKHIEMR